MKMSLSRVLPDIKALGYLNAKSNLVQLDLRDESFAPAAISVHRGHALDRCVPRAGWIAFTPNVEVWAAKFPLGPRPTRVGAWQDCVPSANPSCVWLGGLHGPEAPADARTQTLIEYDGREGTVVNSREIGLDERLRAAHAGGLLIESEGELWLESFGTGERLPLGEAGRVMAQDGETVALECGRRIDILEIGTGDRVVAQRPQEGNWAPFASFSPDGAALAVSLQVTPIFDQNGSVSEGRSSLALIATSDGTVALAPERFAGFGTTPLWTRDGKWCLFNAPIDKSLLLCPFDKKGPLGLQRAMTRRRRPTPLMILEHAE
jgi:hypothetical protein